ncbi:MAG: PAS domain-containing hybrid sensor histidine kinase/response regulator [Calditrichaeota bacterium]|nr:MAG: PAS domain-containing hybrid sensor histidine kinase/response regulator [Calditrichota bacterium]
MGLLDFFRDKKNHPASQMGNLVEMLQDGVFISHLDGRLIYVNQAGRQLLDLPREEDLHHYNFFEHFIPESALKAKVLQALQKEGMLKNLELQLTTRNETLVDVILTISSLTDYREEVIGYLFLVKDVTELKKIQQQLLQSQKLESVGVMASGIAHDFNNILAAIIPNAELIKLSSEPGSENATRAEIIKKSALRASDIASKLLTFTRGQDHEKRLLVLNDVIRDSVDLVQTSMPKNIQVELNLQDGLYPVLADATQIQQVIINLLINARDAMPSGGMIEVSTRNEHVEQAFQEAYLEPGYYIRITVKDTGSGIPVEILPKIFDPFFTTKELGKGTGLGLSMVYGIVKSHNGVITVNSKPQMGTRFDILIPAQPDMAVEGEKEEEEPRLPDGLRFLIIDDEEFVRDILSDILRFMGADVVKAKGGQEGLRLFERHQGEFDYVIIDLRMPGMDGRKTLVELRKMNPRVRAILSSGYDDLDENDVIREFVVGFLPKPYSIKNVKRCLDKILGQTDSSVVQNR